MRSIGTMAVLCVMWAGPVAAAGPVPGEYATQPGYGLLTVTAGKDGVRRFSIDALGVNGHMCTLEGRIEGGVGRTDPDAGEASICSVDFKGEGGAFEVEPRDERCREFCGMRASFAGRYVRVPPGCSPTGREKRNQAFLADYRAKRFPAALRTLQQTEAACGRFFDWAEKDSFANDKALTLHRLGRDKECLAVLAGTLVADNRNEDELREDFWPAPTDWDIYLPIAKATWTNRRLCEAGNKRAAR